MSSEQNQSKIIPVEGSSASPITVTIHRAVSTQIPAGGKGERFVTDAQISEPIYGGPTENPTAKSPPTPPLTKDEENEETVIAQYGSVKAYLKAQTKSSVTEEELPHLREQFQIPEEYKIRVPEEGEKLYKRPDGEWIAIPIYALRYGVRIPLHDFIMSFLSFVGIGFSQLVPNSYIHLVCFIAFRHQNKIAPDIDLLS